jgi:hypothetical protein
VLVIVEIVFYANCTVLIFEDGHREVITKANTEYIQEEVN